MLQYLTIGWQQLSSLSQLYFWVGMLLSNSSYHSTEIQQTVFYYIY